MRTVSGFKVSVIFLTLISLSARAAEGPAKFQVSEFTFTRPASWEWVDVSASPMRKAQLKIPGKGTSQGAEVVFYYFGQSGAGGTQANVDRWFGQFQEPKDQIHAKSEKVKIGKHAVTFVQAEGTNLSGMPGGGQPPTPQPNWMLLGAILESDQGNVFAKLTGPAKLVTASQDEFKKLIRSALE